MGSSANEVYKPDGGRIPNGLHSFEDRSFRFKREEYGLCLYGVFDGFSGAQVRMVTRPSLPQVADFVMKRLPAELLLGQLVPDLPPEMVREQLKQAFVSVDREYFGSIGDRLAARMVMRGEEERPGRQAQLAELEEQVSSGCVAAVALLLNNQIYVANVGDCSAFLVHSAGGPGGLALTPLSVEHTLHNEDERLRLRHLGHGGEQLGGHSYTRCFGDYPVKGGHREVPALAGCRDEPVIPEPEVQGPLVVEEELQLLVLATRSLLDAVARVTGAEPRTEVARLISRHLEEQPAASLSTVAQAAVDQVVRMLAQQAEVDSGPGLVCREDMTLLVRTFARGVQGGTEEPGQGEKTLTTRSSARPARCRRCSTLTPRRPTRSSTTTESSGVYPPQHGRQLAVDEHGRIGGGARGVTPHHRTVCGLPPVLRALGAEERGGGGGELTWSGEDRILIYGQMFNVSSKGWLSSYLPRRVEMALVMGVMMPLAVEPVG